MTSSCIKASYHSVNTRMNMCDFDEIEPKQRDGLYPDLNNIKETALAVASLMMNTELIETQDNYVLFDGVPTLSERISKQRTGSVSKHPLADSEKFRNEFAPSFGSGFLVLSGKKNNLLLTAGHCVCNDAHTGLKSQNEISKIRVVFRYHKTNVNINKKSFEKNDVYKIKKILSYSYNSRDNTIPDWALIKLDREVIGIKPLQVNFSPTLGSSVYALGCPGGTAVKSASIGYSEIKKIESDLIHCDVDAFSGNSGGPIIDRTNNKVIAILIRGNPDYEIDKEHEKIAHEKRLIVHVVNPRYKGYEIGQKIIPEMLDFHKYIAMKGRKMRVALSNNKSGAYVHDLHEKRDGWIFSKKGSIYMMFTIIGIPGGLVMAGYSISQINRTNEKINSYETARKLLAEKANLLEAKHVWKIYNKDLILSEIDFRWIDIVRNMIAYNLDKKMAITLFHEEERYNKKFSPNKILDLLSYLEKIKLKLSYLETEQILKQMQKNDPENAIFYLDEVAKNQAIIEARIRVCIKTTQKEHRYANYPSEDIEKISRHYVEQSPLLTFEAARTELALPSPNN